jgi:hypothetical protein
MMPLDAVLELLARVGASKGVPMLVSEEELGRWPTAAVQAMKKQKLLVKARPASSVVCPGCEQECVMPVHTLTHKRRGPESFVVCDKRDDINRVAVPISMLEQWQASGSSIAELLAGLLGLRRPDTAGDTSAGRWEIGVFKGAKHSSHVVLLADGQLALSLAGHSIALAEVLLFGNKDFELNKRTLLRLVDKPVAGAGDAESAAQRRIRLKKRVQTEKNRGNKTFLKTVAADEGISVSRLKQLVMKTRQSKNPDSRRSVL